MDYIEVFLLGDEIEAISTSREVLLLMKELVPMMISELVQSKNGLISQSSSITSFDLIELTFTHLSNQFLPD